MPGHNSSMVRFGLWVAVSTICHVSAAPVLHTREPRSNSWDIIGAGSSQALGFLSTWPSLFLPESVSMVYDPSTSSQGLTEMVQGTATFALTSLPLTQEMYDEAKQQLAVLPIYTTPTGMVYNIPELLGTHIPEDGATDANSSRFGGSVRFSRDTVSGIFSGEITMWNDPRIVADQATDEVANLLPEKEIMLVVRTQGAGTTQSLNLYTGRDLHEDISNGLVEPHLQTGSSTRMMEAVKDMPYTLGYVGISVLNVHNFDLSFDDIRTAAVQDVGGTYHFPSAFSSDVQTQPLNHSAYLIPLSGPWVQSVSELPFQDTRTDLAYAQEPGFDSASQVPMILQPVKVGSEILGEYPIQTCLHMVMPVLFTDDQAHEEHEERHVTACDRLRAVTRAILFTFESNEAQAILQEIGSRPLKERTQKLVKRILSQMRCRVGDTGEPQLSVYSASAEEFTPTETGTPEPQQNDDNLSMMLLFLLVPLSVLLILAGVAVFLFMRQRRRRVRAEALNKFNYNIKASELQKLTNIAVVQGSENHMLHLDPADDSMVAGAIRLAGETQEVAPRRMSVDNQELIRSSSVANNQNLAESSSSAESSPSKASSSSSSNNNNNNEENRNECELSADSELSATAVPALIHPLRGERRNSLGALPAFGNQNSNILTESDYGMASENSGHLSTVNGTDYLCGKFRGSRVILRRISRKGTTISEKDIEMLYDFRHHSNPCLMTLFGINTDMDPETLCFVSDFSGMKGTLSSYISLGKDSVLSLGWRFSLSMAMDLISGMDYLHNVLNRAHGRLNSHCCQVNQNLRLVIFDPDLTIDRRPVRDYESHDGHVKGVDILMWSAPELYAHVFTEHQESEGTDAGFLQEDTVDFAYLSDAARNTAVPTRQSASGSVCSTLQPAMTTPESSVSYPMSRSSFTSRRSGPRTSLFGTNSFFSRKKSSAGLEKLPKKEKTLEQKLGDLTIEPTKEGDMFSMSMILYHLLRHQEPHSELLNATSGVYLENALLASGVESVGRDSAFEESTGGNNQSAVRQRSSPLAAEVGPLGKSPVVILLESVAKLDMRPTVPMRRPTNRHRTALRQMSYHSDADTIYADGEKGDKFGSDEGATGHRDRRGRGYWSRGRPSVGSIEEVVDVSTLMEYASNVYENEESEVQSSEARNLYCKAMQLCWSAAPESRPTVEQLKIVMEKLPDAQQCMTDKITTMLHTYTEDLEQSVRKRTALLHAEMERADTLLNSLLPSSIAANLKNGNPCVPENYDMATIFFSDIVAFTKYCSARPPFEVINTLNELYAEMDELARQHNIYRMELIGDAYMATSGVPDRNVSPEEQALRVCSFAVEVLQSVAQVLPDIQLRIGIHAGPCVAGLLGDVKKPRFTVIGDAVNIASRMESTSEPSRIQVSDAVRQNLGRMQGGFLLQERGTVEIKGRGSHKTFWLTRQPQRRRSSIILSAVVPMKVDEEESEESTNLLTRDEKAEDMV
eukprot:Clim_evm18s235 gene=Clim_evmTU18s235